MADYVFGTQPFDHQLKRFLSYRDKEFHGHFWEQGTGKSKITVDTASWLYANGKIGAVLVVAPNGVHNNWIINEFPIHTPDYIDYKSAWYASSMTKKESTRLKEAVDYKGLSIVAMNVEAFATNKGAEFARTYLLNKPTLFVVDESSVIKNHKAIRTKAILKLAKHAAYRRILTGTPVTQGPLDVFPQFMFLDEYILGTASYYAFRGKYAQMKEIKTNGRSVMVVDKYCNLDDLQRLIAPHCDRVLKSECLDLPEKLYQKHYVELSDNQRRLYTALKKDIIAEFNGKQMSTPLALTKLLRAQQVIGGFFQEDVEVEFDDDMMPIFSEKKPPTPIDKNNPRISALISILESTPGKAIIFARFRSEIQAICEAISQVFGAGVAVEYHGGVQQKDRSEAVRAFQEEKFPEYFVANVQTAGKGLTLTAATTVIYYSNDFSLENRLQSEDRPHRIGQKHNVTYIDIIAKDTIDEKIVEILRSKKNVADLLTGDEPLEIWL